MERITGICLSGGETACSREGLAACSVVARGMLRYLVESCAVTYAQVLFPYADALSLSGAKGTESTRLFGTHLLLRNVNGEHIRAAFQAGMAFAASEGFAPERAGIRRCEGTAFPLIEGCAAAENIAAFLRCECDAPTVGNFAAMMGGFVPHWRVREAAKEFASFSEMAWRVSKGGVCGLAGGRLVLRGDGQDETAEKLRDICFRKTGVR